MVDFNSPYSNQPVGKRHSNPDQEGHLETSKLGVVLVDLAQDMKKRDILTLQDQWETMGSLGSPNISGT